MMRIVRRSAVAALCLVGAAQTAASQYAAPSAVRAQPAASVLAAPAGFNDRIRPHIRDGFRRSLIGTAASIVGMAIGVGIEELNSSQCGSQQICPLTNTMKTAASYGFVFAVVGAVAPESGSRCSRSARALLALGGAVVGVTIAGAIADTRYLEALPGTKATVGNLTGGAVGMGFGAGAFAAIC